MSTDDVTSKGLKRTQVYPAIMDVFYRCNICWCIMSSVIHHPSSVLQLSETSAPLQKKKKTPAVKNIRFGCQTWLVACGNIIKQVDALIDQTVEKNGSNNKGKILTLSVFGACKYHKFWVYGQKKILYNKC